MADTKAAKGSFHLSRPVFAYAKTKERDEPLPNRILDHWNTLIVIYIFLIYLQKRLLPYERNVQKLLIYIYIYISLFWQQSSCNFKMQYIAELIWAHSHPNCFIAILSLTFKSIMNHNSDNSYHTDQGYRSPEDC